MNHTWAELQVMSMNEPALHHIFTLVMRGDLTQEQALIEGLYWYVQALQSCRAQLLEAINVRPAPWVITPGEPLSPREDGRYR